jgi:hypothetical protein
LPPPLDVVPEFVESLDGRLTAFAVHKDATVRYISQLEPGGRWIPPWQVMTPPANNFLFGVRPVLDGAGCINVFVLGGGGIANSLGGNCWHRVQTSLGGAWGAWRELGAVNPPLDRAWLGELVASRNQDGRLTLVALSSGDILHNSQTSVGGDWTGWVRIHDWHV